jgi:hypothetical protein
MRSTVSSSVRCGLIGVRLIGSVSALIAPPFHRTTSSTRRVGGVAVYADSDFVDRGAQQLFRSWSVMVSVSHTGSRLSLRAKMADFSCAISVFRCLLSRRASSASGSANRCRAWFCGSRALIDPAGAQQHVVTRAARGPWAYSRRSTPHPPVQR